MVESLRKRKLLECFACKCMRCPLTDENVPADCEYLEFQMMSKYPAGRFMVADRQSGKTTMVMKVAMELQKAGFKVAVLVTHMHIATRMQRDYMGSGITFVSAGSAFDSIMRNRLVGVGSFLLSDEVSFRKASQLANELGMKYVFGAGGSECAW